VQEKQQKKSVKNMKKESNFPFERARRVTNQENQEFRKAISEQFSIELRKRDLPSKEEDDY